MNDDRTHQPSAIADDFRDLNQRLAAFVEEGQPTDDNLHFATFSQVNEATLADLSRLAQEGRILLRSDERGQCPLTCWTGANPATAKRELP